MKRSYLITLPERLWHWANALVFIVLVLSGFLMHKSESVAWISLVALIKIHNVAAALFVINFTYWFVLQIVTGRIKHYVKFERDMARRLLIQAKFYMFDIFFEKPHPFPPDPDSKFNPLQRFTYIGLMFVIVPLQVLSGAVLYGFTLRIGWLMNLPAFRTIALTHTALSYLLISFLVGHLYLATTGDTPLSLYKSMVTGYHEANHSGKDTTNEAA